MMGKVNIDKLTLYEQKFIQAVGARIQALRDQRELDLETMATNISRSPQWLDKLEKGKVDPYLEDLFYIARALDTSVSDLVRVKVAP